MGLKRRLWTLTNEEAAEMHKHLIITVAVGGAGGGHLLPPPHFFPKKNFENLKLRN